MLVHFFLQESLFLRLRMNVPFFGNLNLERSLNVLESFISTVKVLLETELLSVYCRCNKKTASLILKNVPMSFEFFVMLDNSFPFLWPLFIFLTKKVNIKTFVTESQPGYDFRMFIKFWLILARLFWQKVSQKKFKKSLVSLTSYECQSVQDNKSSNSNVLQYLTSSCQNVALFHWRKKFLGNIKMIAYHVSLQCKKL